MNKKVMKDYAELDGKNAVLHVRQYEEDGKKYQMIAAQIEGFENVFVLRIDKQE